MSTKHEQSMVQAMEEGDDAAVKRLLSGAVEAFKVELRNQGSNSSICIVLVEQNNSPHFSIIHV